MQSSTRDRILERLDRLPETMLGEILQFIDSLINYLPRPLGIPGIVLKDLAGSLPPEDAMEMRQAIENDCARIDFDEW
ncbi:MAG: hypothetical protein WBB29_02545 [Geitlerinemataceae cyanobacterium]